MCLARVMLRRNIRPEIGLVNGACGVLVGIDNDGDRPFKLKIQFDNVAEVQEILKVIFTYA